MKNKFENYIKELSAKYESIPKTIIKAITERDFENMLGTNWRNYNPSCGNTYVDFENAVYELSKTVKRNILKKEFDWIFYSQNKDSYSKEAAKEFIEQELKKDYVNLILNPVYKED